MDFVKQNIRRVLVEGLGWILVAAGIAALVLPGPGLLLLFAGMALLATQYEWAERRLEPIRKAALKTATDSVTSWIRITLSTLLGLLLIAFGVFWGVHPAVPSWWPLANKWWLIGGWGTGGTIIGSGVIALITIAYSYHMFRPSGSKHKH